eukprot:11223719-Lingulodinium_polyedra.AAC.1
MNWGPGQFGPCPLCGTGEAGSEHFLQWRPAPQAAWVALAGADGSLRGAIASFSARDVLTARVLHQASYLHHA